MKSSKKQTEYDFQTWWNGHFFYNNSFYGSYKKLHALGGIWSIYNPAS
jgi:hypothetical protein